MSGRVGVVCGLAAEAECLDSFPSELRPSIGVAGASAARARAAAAKLIGEGCVGLVSFGVAGGLDPALHAGDVVLADAVVAQDGKRWPTSDAWRNAVRDRVGGPAISVGPMSGRDEALVSPEAKAAERQRTGAVAVDMESHGVAAAAAEAGVPFLVVRAVADPAGRAIPGWIIGALAADGTVIPQKIAKHLLAKPWVVWTLIGLARENGRALRKLRTAADALGPAFSFPGR